MDSLELDLLIKNLIGVVPMYKYIHEFKPDKPFENIYAITYDGVNYLDKKTKVFAYLGFPKDLRKDEKRKAVVLVHGGGGHAFLSWVKIWNDLGYIAIAMNTAGDFPLIKNAWDTERKDDGKTCKRELCGVFKEEGYTEIPTTAPLTKGDEEISCQRYYHYVTSAILASNILFSLPNVDVSKVGITGVSWGGVITSTIIGYDNRYAFAIPIYGSAYISESMFDPWKTSFKEEKVNELWASERNLQNAKMPILWLCWNDDCCFSINSNSKSFLATYKNNSKTLYSAINNMFHSHIDAWKMKENYIFAESVVNGGVSLTKISGDYDSKDINLRLDYDSRVDGKTIKARLYYLEDYPLFEKIDKYIYKNKIFSNLTWKTMELSITGDRVIGKVPKKAELFYVEVETIINGDKTYTCSPCEHYRGK